MANDSEFGEAKFVSLRWLFSGARKVAQNVLRPSAWGRMRAVHTLRGALKSVWKQKQLPINHEDVVRFKIFHC